MSKTHWLKNPNKNYFGHWDIPESGEIELTIKTAAWEEVKDPVTGRKEVKRVVYFHEKVKPLICNQTNAISIVAATGCRYFEDTNGKKVILFRTTTFNRKNKIDVDCVRIKNDAPVVKPKPKPELKSKTEDYKKVVAAVKGGYNFEQIRSKYTVSAEIETKILTEIKKENEPTA